MVDRPETGSSHEVVCPHCRRSFEAKLMGGDSERHRGFKCPHCRLFVAFDRAEEQEGGERPKGPTRSP